MTIPELLKTIDCPTLLVDTREQNTLALRRRLKDINWPVERLKLNFGDYSAKFQMPDGNCFSLADAVCIERKMSLDELAMCFTTDRKRFEREFERAKEANARIYLLVEQMTWGKVFDHQYRSQMLPQALAASILAFMARYDCKLIACEPKQTGQLIAEILKKEAKERLEMMVE